MTSPSSCRAVPLLALLLLLLTAVACNSAYTGTGTGAGAGTNYPFVSAITLQPGSAPSIAVAGTVQVGANEGNQVSATEVQYNDVTTSAKWSSSNDVVATVSKGLVTGTKIGSATISASLNGKTGKTLVVVGQTATLDITRLVRARSAYQ
jgi:Big-like domain-containing protein